MLLRSACSSATRTQVVPRPVGREDRKGAAGGYGWHAMGAWKGGEKKVGRWWQVLDRARARKSGAQKVAQCVLLQENDTEGGAWVPHQPAMSNALPRASAPFSRMPNGRGTGGQGNPMYSAGFLFFFFFFFQVRLPS